MAERSATGPSGPERERGNARRLTIPIIIMVVPVAPVMLIAMLIVRPWESEGGGFERSEPIATPTVAP